MPENKDPRNIGTSGLTGLKGLKIIGPGSMSESIQASQLYKEQAPSVEYVGYVGAGNSSYERGKELNPSQYYNLQDYRGEEQSSLLQLTNGLAKGVILAGTTFLDGTIGLATGIITAIGEGRLSGLWDNDFSRAMKAVNDWAEETMPNYYTEDERENPFSARNIFSGNFIGDKFIKNLGFTVGAFYSGGIWNKPLSAIKAVKATGALPHVATGLGAIISALNEGRIEALNNSTDWYNLQKAQLDEVYDRELEGLDLYRNTDSYQTLIDNLNTDYNQKLEQIKDNSLKMGNTDMLLNLPILVASNVITFGRLYARGFNTANKGYNIAKSAGKYTAEYSKAGKVIAGIKGGLSQGMEEVSQQIASNTSGNLFLPREGYNLSFNQAVLDSDANEQTVDWIKQFGQAALEGTKQAFGEDYNDTMEQFLIGSLTGILGMPTFGRTNNQNAWLGKNKLIGISGGTIGEIQAYNEEQRNAEEIVQKLNERIADPDFQNYYQSLLRHNKFQNDMNRAAQEGKAKEYKDAEYAQLISDVALFAEAGKIDDLRSLVEEAYDTSDENLASIIKNTTTSTGEMAGRGPFVDDTGNALTATEEGKKEMVDSITKKKDRVLKAIDDYRKVNSLIVQQFGDNLTKEQRQELVWLSLLSQEQAKRATEVASQSKPYIEKIISDIDLQIERIRVEEDYSINQNDSSKKERAKKLEALQRNKQILTNFLSMKDSELAYNIKANKNLILSIDRKVIDEIVDDTDNIQSKKNFVRDLNDIESLLTDAERYQKKLNEYLENSQKLAQDQERERKKEEKKADKIKSRLDTAKNFDDVREALGNDDSEDQSKRNALDNSTSDAAKGFNEAQKKLKSIRDNLATYTSDIQVLSDANDLIENALKKMQSVDDINPDSDLFLNPDNLRPKQGETFEQRAERLKNANELIRKALGKSQKDAVQSPDTGNINDNTDVLTPEQGSSDTSETSGKTTPANTNGKVTSRPEVTGSITEIQSNNETTFVPLDEPVPAITTTSQKVDIADDNKSEQTTETKDQWIPAVPQYDFAGMERGEFTTQHETKTESAKKGFEEWDRVHLYIESQGGFDFCNNGSLMQYWKNGGKIYFGIDPNFNGNANTIFIFVKQNDTYIPVGSMYVSKYKTDSYTGMTAFNEVIQKEYEQRENKEGLFISQYTSELTGINRGRVRFGDNAQLVRDVIQHPESEVKIPRIVVIKSGGLVNAENAAYPPNMSEKEGMAYIQVPNGRRGGNAGNTLVPIIPVRFTSSLLQSGSATNSVLKEIDTAINNLTTAVYSNNREALRIALGELNNNLLLSDYEFSLNDNGTFFINKKIKEGKQYKWKTVKVNGTDKQFHETQILASINTQLSPDDIRSIIVNTLESQQIPIRIDANRLSNSETQQAYSKTLVDGGLVETHCPVLRVEAAYPLIKPVSLQQQEAPVQPLIPVPIQPEITPQTPVLNEDEMSEQDDFLSQLSNGTFALSERAETPTKLVEQTKAKAVRELKRMFPGIKAEALVRIVDNLISSTGTPLNGMINLKNGIITLSRIGEKGTIYHEAYHLVSQTLLTEGERNHIYEEAKRVYGDLSNDRLEEALADGFRDYMNGRRENLLTRIRDWFKRLFNIVTKADAITSSIPVLYDSIATGRFANKELSGEDKILESRQDALRQAEDEWRRLQKLSESFNNRWTGTYREAKIKAYELNKQAGKSYNFAEVVGIRPNVFTLKLNVPSLQSIQEDYVSFDETINESNRPWSPSLQQVEILENMGFDEEEIALLTKDEFENLTQC